MCACATKQSHLDVGRWFSGVRAAVEGDELESEGHWWQTVRLFLLNWISLKKKLPMFNFYAYSQLSYNANQYVKFKTGNWFTICS